MNQEHRDNLALLREGRGITDGGKYLTSVKEYCGHHGLEIPEQDREPEPEAGSDVLEQVAGALADLDQYLQHDDAGNVRTVLLGDWREAVEADQDERQILAITPEDWQESFQPKLDEVESLTKRAEKAEGELKAIKDEALENWLPEDLKARLVAIRGVGPALADSIVADLTR